MDWGPLVVALIGGFTSAPLWNYFTKKMGWNQSEADRLRQELEAEKQKVADLTERVAVVEHHHASAFARWILDAHKRVVWINAKAMVSIFGPIGLTRSEIEGRTFHDLVDTAAAGDIERLAMAALTHDGAAVSGLIRLHPDLPIMHIVKIATAGRGGELIFEATAFRSNDPDVVIGLGVARTALQRQASIDRLTNKDEPPPHG